MLVAFFVVIPETMYTQMHCKHQNQCHGTDSWEYVNFQILHCLITELQIRFLKGFYVVVSMAIQAFEWKRCKFVVRVRVTTKRYASLGGLEPPTFRLTAERANRLRHRDL